MICIDDEEAILNIYNRIFSKKESKNRFISSKSSNTFDLDLEIRYANSGQIGLDMTKAIYEQGEKIDIALVDVRMPPGIDGTVVTRELKAIDPSIEVLIISGFADEDIIDELSNDIDGKLYFVEKPFMAKELQDLVKKILKERNV